MFPIRLILLTKLPSGVNTAIFDYAADGNLEEMLGDRHELSQWTSKHKLRYAWQISKGLADLHSVGNVHDSAAIAHTDISPDQYLWSDGMFKVCACFNDNMKVRLFKFFPRVLIIVLWIVE